MRTITTLLAAFILILGVALDSGAATLSQAEKHIGGGDYSAAEGELKELLADEPGNARAHQLLGDAYKRQSKFDAALAEYDRAIELGGANVGLYESIGSINKWTGRDREAARAYRKALELNPDSVSAKDDLRELRLSRGLEVTVMYGGWGPDYTTDAYELMLKYSGVDNLDLYAGYGFADQVYYDRTKYYAKAYYFYGPGNYFKVNPQYKDYDYPAEKVQVPDSNSYDKVPSVELEVQYWVTDDFRVNGIYEYSRASFFHDTDSHANNQKITGEVYWITPYEYLRLKGFIALLRDPDPDTTEIKGRTCIANCTTLTPTLAAETSVDYQLQALAGGAVEYDRGPWEAEVKYIPNRDLDSSYDWSILAGAGYDFTDRFTGRFDTVYDKYSSQSNFAGSTANVYLVSGYYELTDAVDVGAGYKYLDLADRKENAVFATLSYRTGIGF